MVKNRSIILIVVVLAIIFANEKYYGQTSSKLKQQEKELQKKIENTQNLIKLTRNSEQLTIAELAILNHQIAYREELVLNINYQMRKIEEEIEALEVQIIQLENNITILKDEYAKMLQYAYKNRNDEFNLYYVFSAKTYSEAYKRMQYIDQYADYRTQQILKIQETKTLLDSNLVQLNTAKVEKEQIAKLQEEEKQNFLKDKEEQQNALMKLKLNEQQYTSQLQSQQKEKQKIQAKINEAIAKELAAAEAASKNKGFTMTPEATTLAKSFTSNKGKLPWPVEKGAITTQYGKHQHQDYINVTTESKGIDITTDLGASVRAIFGGTVSSIFTIPGAGKVVMISHGNYRTVYANLQEVYVQKGDKVETKDVIGKLLPATSGNVSEAHLEIWKISSAGTDTENPELWIKK
ncbi:MAG: peptidoglycan DD-metalloendopeptidase family protein [Flavobacteriales bacterium]|nr:peptidoglycan DD-metalloendopeptidase family protein [Flavobacteriales bacterium]